MSNNLHRYKCCRCSSVVDFLGGFEDEEALYVVQEWCAGGDLFAALHKSGGTLPEAWVACQVRHRLADSIHRHQLHSKTCLAVDLIIRPV